MTIAEDLKEIIEGLISRTIPPNNVISEILHGPFDLPSLPKDDAFEK